MITSKPRPSQAQLFSRRTTQSDQWNEEDDLDDSPGMYGQAERVERYSGPYDDRFNNRAKGWSGMAWRDRAQPLDNYNRELSYPKQGWQGYEQGYGEQVYERQGYENDQVIMRNGGYENDQVVMRNRVANNSKGGLLSKLSSLFSKRDTRKDTPTVDVLDRRAVILKKPGQPNQVEVSKFVNSMRKREDEPTQPKPSSVRVFDQYIIQKKPPVASVPLPKIEPVQEQQQEEEEFIPSSSIIEQDDDEEEDNMNAAWKKWEH